MSKQKKYSEAESILLASDKKFAQARNILSKMYRRILLENSVMPGQFSHLMRAWCKKHVKGEQQMISLQANTTTALLKDEMTWKTLMKGLDVLQFTSVRITLECHHRNGHVTTITEVLDNSTYNDIDD